MLLTLTRLFLLSRLFHSTSGSRCTSGWLLEDSMVSAATKGNLVVIQCLLEKGKDVNAPDGFLGSLGSTPLFSAISSSLNDDELIKVVKLLVESGATIRSEDLTETIKRGRVGIVEYLLTMSNLHTENGFLVNAINILQGQVNKLKIIQTLLRAGADHSSQCGRTLLTPLGMSLQHNDIEIIRTLLQGGGDSNIVLNGDSSILSMAITQNKFEVFLALLEEGANPNVTIGEKGTVLTIAIALNQMKFVKKILQHGINVNSPPIGPSNPLSMAVSNQLDEYIHILLENGANTNIQGNSFSNPLRIAVSLNNTQLVEILLNGGANPNLLYDDNNPLRIARQQNNARMIEKLIEFGAKDKSSISSYFTVSLFSMICGSLMIYFVEELSCLTIIHYVSAPLIAYFALFCGSHLYLWSCIISYLSGYSRLVCCDRVLKYAWWIVFPLSLFLMPFLVRCIYGLFLFGFCILVTLGCTWYYSLFEPLTMSNDHLQILIQLIGGCLILVGTFEYDNMFALGSILIITAKMDYFKEIFDRNEMLKEGLASKPAYTYLHPTPMTGDEYTLQGKTHTILALKKLQEYLQTNEGKKESIKLLTKSIQRGKVPQANVKLFKLFSEGKHDGTVDPVSDNEESEEDQDRPKPAGGVNFLITSCLVLVLSICLTQYHFESVDEIRCSYLYPRDSFDHFNCKTADLRNAAIKEVFGLVFG